MKKLFSFLIICFVLCFGSVVFGYSSSYLPYNQLVNAINSNSGNIDIRPYYETAISYFFNDSLHISSIQDDSYNFIVFPSAPGANTYVSFYYIGVFNDNEIIITGDNQTDGYVAWIAKDSLGNSLSNGFNYIYGNVRIDLSDGSIISNSVLSSKSNSNGGYSSFARFKYTGGTYNNKFIAYANSISAYSESVYSSRGFIRQINNSTITDFLTNVNTAPSITSSDYFNISVSRDSLEQVSDGIHNYYANTNIDFSFNQYFSDNISTDADLYYTLIIDNLDYSFIPITKATNGYTNNRVRLDISTANSYMLSNINNGLTFVCWYQLPNSSVRLGQTSYKFYLNANYTSTGTSSSGSDNYVSVTGTDNNLPVNITNVIQYDDNLNNSGIDNTNSSDIDFSDGDMRSRFSAMFDFFAIAFSWLPSEIITMVKAGFAIAVVFIIYKIIRG